MDGNGVGSGASTAARAAVVATERWFVRRGLPHLIDGYSPTRDVLTRSVPVLTLVFLIEVVNAPKASFPIWLDVLAVAGGVAILLGAWMLANRLRDRPVLSRPTDVGGWEMAVFVLAPALIPLVFGGQLASAAVTAGVNVVLLGGIYVVTSYGLIPMTRWGIVETVHELNAVAGLFVRALPLLVLFVTFIFLQNEAWQITADLHGPFYWIVLGLFPAVGGVFAIVRLPKEIGALSRVESPADLAERVRGTPAEPLAAPRGKVATEPSPLSARQWGNVGLVVLYSQLLQVLFVSIMAFAFLLGFGILVMTAPITAGFTGAEPHALATLDLWGRELVLTEELLRVTGFLAVFSGFYFAVSVLTDEAYRREFLDEVVGEMRRALAVRAVYLGALRSTTLPST